MCDMSQVSHDKAEKRGGYGFSATKTKVARNCVKWIDLVSNNFPSFFVGGGAFLAQKPKLLEIA